MFYSLSVLPTKDHGKKLLLVSEHRERLESFMMDITADKTIIIKGKTRHSKEIYPYFVIEEFHKVI